MRTILYIANLRLPTEKAYGIQISKMCEAFGSADFDVTLVYPFRGTPITENLHTYYSVKKNFNTKMIWAPDFYFPGSMDKVAVNIKNFISAIILCLYAINNKFDIIYSRDEWPVYLLSFFRDNIVFEAHKFSKGRSFFYKRFLSKDLKIVAISNNLKNDFLDFGFKDTDLLVGHDGVDMADFDIQISKEEARNKTGLPQNEKIIMYTGHLFDWKGADTLAISAKSMPDMKFVFIGGTDYDLNIFKNKFGNFPNIIIIGYKSHKEIPFYLKAADILVLPSSAKDKLSNYTSPIKMFEYMASGRPIVASDLPSVREILNDKNSVLARADNSESFISGIKSIIESSDFGQALSQKAFEEVKNYTWLERAKKIANFIK